MLARQYNAKSQSKLVVESISRWEKYNTDKFHKYQQLFEVVLKLVRIQYK